MTAQSLDLIHELQGELGWTPDFATTAHSEYMRWLRLRSQSGDFQYCKLPPSRVVATVWDLHRQWTLDYQNTCSGLGGYIHHFPPSMRMNIAREQAYAATLHTYKNMYKEDPPASHWGPAICAYKPLSSSGLPPVVNQGAPEPPPRALPSLRRSPAKRDTSMLNPPSTPTKQKARAVADATSRRNSAVTPNVTPAPTDKSRPAADAARPQRRNSKAAKDNKILTAAVDEPVQEGADHPMRSPGRPRKKFSGPSPLYVLRPLRPGEKRKRGRPSFSDYVLVSNLNQAAATAGDAKKKDLKTVADKSAATAKAAGSTFSLRRRKSAASPSKPTAVAPTIVKKEKGHKPFRRVARASASSTISDAKSTEVNVPTTAASATANQTQPGQEPKEGAAPVKRPRGRPRKDGSWPVSRARKTETASKPAVPVTQKPSAALVAAQKPKEKEDDASRIDPSRSDAAKGDQAKAAESAVEASSALPAPASAVQPMHASVLPPVPGSGLPVPAPTTSLPLVSNGTSLPLVSNGTPAVTTGVVPHMPESITAPMPSPMEVTMQAKHVPPVENVLGSGVMDNAVPSKVIEGRDLQMHDLGDKEVQKQQVIPESIPRDAVFEQIIDGSGLVEKDRPVDISNMSNPLNPLNPLAGKDVRMGPDVVFPQSESMRDPTEMEHKFVAKRNFLP